MTKVSFDWEECLRLSNKKKDLAKELLGMLEKELPEFQANLKQAINAKDNKQLRQNAHKLHGACCYTGVPKLKQLVEQLESQIQSNQQDQLIASVNQIEKEINEVLKAIKKR